MWKELASIPNTEKKKKVSVKISKISPSPAGFRVDRSVTGHDGEVEKQGWPAWRTPRPASKGSAADRPAL